MKQSGFQRLIKANNTIKVLLFSNFLIPFASFMLLPFIPIILINELGFSATLVGVVLSVTALIQFCGSLLGSYLANTIGLRNTMVLALFLRTFGFLLSLLMFIDKYSVIYGYVLIVSGSAFYIPASKAYLVRCISEEDRPLFLSITNSASNLGIAVSPIIGGILLTLNLYLSYITVASIFFILLIIHILLLKKEDSVDGKEKLFMPFPIVKSISLPLVINLVGAYFFFFFQNYFPVYGQEIFSTVFVSIALAINAIILIIAQPLLSNFINKTSFHHLILYSFVLLALSYLAISIKNYYMIIIGIILVSIYEVIVALKNDLVIIEKVEAKYLTTSFAYQRVGFGIGAAGTGIIGGYTINNLKINAVDFSYFWYIARMFNISCLVKKTVLNHL